MKPYSAQLQAEKAKAAIIKFWLIKIAADGYTDAPISILYDGTTYDPWSIDVAPISNTKDIVLDGLQITMSNLPVPPNTLHPLSSFVLNGDWKNADVLIYEAFFDTNMALVTEGTDLVFKGTVSGRPYLSESKCVVTVIPFQNPWSRTIPNRPISKNCGWDFKDPDTCKYAGGGTCPDRTWETCLALGNTINFGGFARAKSAFTIIWGNSKIEVNGGNTSPGTNRVVYY